jgi:carbamoylphosphate synthase small subunit
MFNSRTIFCFLPKSSKTTLKSEPVELRAGFTDNKADIESLVQHLKTTELPRDEVSTVSTKTPYVSTGSDLSVVLLDFGKKQNIVRECLETF